MADHYVYKYVSHGQTIYIGKADSGLQRRIDEHALESRFQKYPDAEIFCMRLNNAAETTCMEMLLINKYKPLLNYKDKYPEPLSIRFEEPPWVPALDVVMKVHEEMVCPDVIKQERTFWSSVLQDIQDGNSPCFSISRGLIPGIDPRGFSISGIYYPVFSLRFDVGPVANFIYTAAGRSNVRGHVREYLESKEDGSNVQAGTHTSD